MFFNSKEKFLKFYRVFTSFKILGIDYGQKKTGLAVYNNKINIILQKPTILNVFNNLTSLFKLIEHEKINGIVIGLPLKRNGSLPDNFTEIKKLCDYLLIKTKLPYCFSDERYTTALANVLLKQLHIKRKRRHKIDDQLSAYIILDNFFY